MATRPIDPTHQASGQRARDDFSFEQQDSESRPKSGAKPDQEATNAFANLLKSKSKNGKEKTPDAEAPKGEEQSKPEQQMPRGLPLSPGEAILRSMAGAGGVTPMVKEGSGEVADVKTPQSAVVELCNKIVEHFLVKENAKAGGEEIRLVLKGTVLGSTEVRLSQDAGALKVLFIAASPNAHELLMRNQPLCEQYLKQHLKGKSVRVAVLGEGEEEEGQSPHDEDISRITRARRDY